MKPSGDERIRPEPCVWVDWFPRWLDNPAVSVTAGVLCVFPVSSASTPRVWSKD